MARRSRVGRIAKWTGLGLLLLILSAWAVSIRDCWAINMGDGHIRLTDGMLRYYQGFSLLPGLHRFDTQGELGFRLPKIRRDVISAEYGVPLWLPIFIVGSSIGWISYRDRRPGKDHCQTCGYDLTGNESGVCPECAAPVHTQEKIA